MPGPNRGHSTMSRKALLVGINEFDQLDDRAWINPLYGCVNDTELIRQLLIDHFGFRESEIEVLQNESATGDAIRGGLDRLLSDYVGNGTDVRFFSLSTHGTQIEAENAGEESDSLDEAFIAHDHRWQEPFRDNELKRIFDRVPEGVSLIIVADTCYSGTIQQFAVGASSSPKFRRTVGRFAANPFLRGPRPMRAVPSSDFAIVTAPRHVLLSACRAGQQSTEIMVLPGGQRQGALSWAFAETVKNRGSQLSYEELIEGIGSELDTLPQTPQLECPDGYRTLQVLAPFGGGSTKPEGVSDMGDEKQSEQEQLEQARVSVITYLAAYTADPAKYKGKKKRRKLMEAAGIPRKLREALESGDLQKIANVMAPVFKPKIYNPPAE